MPTNDFWPWVACANPFSQYNRGGGGGEGFVATLPH